MLVNRHILQANGFERKYIDAIVRRAVKSDSVTSIDIMGVSDKNRLSLLVNFHLDEMIECQEQRLNTVFNLYRPQCLKLGKDLRDLRDKLKDELCETAKENS